MKNIIDALKEEATRMEQQLATIGKAIGVLGGRNSTNGRKHRNDRKHRNGLRKRHFSEASKRRMSQAAKTRWANIKAAKKNA